MKTYTVTYVLGAKEIETTGTIVATEWDDCPAIRITGPKIAGQYQISEIVLVGEVKSIVCEGEDVTEAICVPIEAACS